MPRTHNATAQGSPYVPSLPRAVQRVKGNHCGTKPDERWVLPPKGSAFPNDPRSQADQDGGAGALEVESLAQGRRKPAPHEARDARERGQRELVGVFRQSQASHDDEPEGISAPRAAPAP